MHEVLDVLCAIDMKHDRRAVIFIGLAAKPLDEVPEGELSPKFP
jgi:hypothetical protein